MVRGILMLAPVCITFYIIYNVFVTVDGWIPIEVSFGSSIIRLYGIGLALVMIVIFLVGYFGSSFLSVPVFNMIEAKLSKIPLIGIIYQSLKDLTKAFVGDKKKFNVPVLFVLNKESQIRKIGFVTQNDLTFIGLSGFISVYCPHSYAFSGEMFIVDSSHVTPLNISTAQAMKFIVSGGVSINLEE